MCGDNQGIVSKEKVDRVDGTNGANRAGETDGGGAGEANGGGANAEELDRVNGANRENGDRADTKEPDGANRTDRIDKADRVDRANRADRANRVDRTNRADGVDGVNKTNGVDEANGGKADAEKRRDLGDLGLVDPRVERQKVARRVATRLSFFSFYIIFCLFFFPSKSEICGST